MKPAIIVVAFNRPESLNRLLVSLQEGHYTDVDIDLIISIDYEESERRNEVVRIADWFSWNHGTKLIINHVVNLGLREHVLSCGDLTRKYGSIVLLEDDLVVSKEFYTYVQTALGFYREDRRIGGVALYNHRKNPLNKLFFEMIPDDNDVYFLQFACSWGQAWTFNQWQAFRDWYASATDLQDHPIPEGVKKWPETSWLKFFITYLVASDSYFVYPTKSFSTNFSDSGTHNKAVNTDFQVPLFFGEPNTLRFQEMDKSINVYDVFFELTPRVLAQLNSAYRDKDITIDLYGMKPLHIIKTRYLLSSKPMAHITTKPLAAYALKMKPAILNVVYNLTGSGIRMSETRLFSNRFKGLDISDNVIWDYFVFKLKPTVYLKIFIQKAILKMKGIFK